MILSAQSIEARVRRTWSTRGLDLDIRPFCYRTVVHGMSYGLSAAGYDLRVSFEVLLPPGGFILATTIERVVLPADLMAHLADKSSWARCGIAIQNTIFEPGWRGYPTIEISNHGPQHVTIAAGAPIAQMIFHVLDQPTDYPYAGKYQDQPQRPVEAIEER